MRIIALIVTLTACILAGEEILCVDAKYTVANDNYIIEVIVQDDVAYLPIQFESVNLIEKSNSGLTTSHRDTGMARWPDGFKKYTKGQKYIMKIETHKTLRPTEIYLWAGLRDKDGKLLALDIKSRLVTDGGVIYERIKAYP